MFKTVEASCGGKNTAIKFLIGVFLVNFLALTFSVWTLIFTSVCSALFLLCYLGLGFVCVLLL